MNTIYENIYIGVFIYSLGFLVAKNKQVSSLSSAINLYQQTPGDTTLGDFFCNIGGRSLLIEFKKEWKEVNTERRKPAKEKLLNKLGREARLQAISLKTHFLACPYEFSGSERDLYFFPYVYLLNEEKINVELMGNFIGRYLDQQVGSEGKEFAEYLEALRPVAQSAQGGAKEISGLIVNLNEQGRITCDAFDDVRTIQRNILELDRTISLERGFERVRSRDMDGPSR
jgi:hypothetical protein